MIYIDPPFYSKANYDAVLHAGDENIKHLAYGDKWEKGMAEYLKMLTVRLLLMKDLLADDGLIWLHLDWHVVHYAKVIMDEIFGEQHMINEIIWTYKSGGTSKKHFSRKHDTILVYSKTKKYNFYPIQEKSYNRQFKPYRFKGVKEYKDDTGWYTMVNMKDVWTIDMVGRTSAERTGYATQKPEALLKRIIESCTVEGDICADFFCGSGTLPAVATKLNRKFIACDEGRLAVENTMARLHHQGCSFSVYETNSTKKKDTLSANIQLLAEEVPGTENALLTVSIESIKEKSLAKALDEASREKVKKLMKDNPLQLIEYWSVDFNCRDTVHRPELIFMRNKGDLETSCQKIVKGETVIGVKVVDIFGNVTVERIEYEGNA
ncbi:site-specific DNA-methyltransferase (adenine-specific) [Clostridiales Family XIII bacterium PM5-7]